MGEATGAQVFLDGVVSAGDGDRGVGLGGGCGDLDDVSDAGTGGCVDDSGFEFDLRGAVGHGEEELVGALEGGVQGVGVGGVGVLDLDGRLVSAGCAGDRPVRGTGQRADGHAGRGEAVEQGVPGRSGRSHDDDHRVLIPW